MKPAHEYRAFGLTSLLGAVIFSSGGCSRTIVKGENQLEGYPIASEVQTTRQRTIVPDAIPAGSEKVAPHEISRFQKNGYGSWHYGPGVELVKRLDLMPASYSGTSAANKATLLNFFAVTDIHITDEESPAQAVYYGYKWGVISGYSPAMLFTTHTLDAAIQTANALHKKNPFDFGMALGDSANCTQYNELRWFIDVMDGKEIKPDSGVKDDPIPGPYNDYQDAYQPAGLDQTIPWYQAIGNHDHFWMGMFPPDDYVKSALAGGAMLNQGNIFTDPSGIKSRGFYMGAIDGRTPYGDVAGAGPVAEFKTPPTVPADGDRRSLSRKEWLGEFFKTSSLPVGHGFDPADAARGFACYTFEPKSIVPVKVIVLDDTQWDADHTGSGAYGNGSLDSERYAWLVKELDKGQSEGKLMIIAAHIPIGIELPKTGIGSKTGWSRYASVTEPTLIAKLHEYPNLVLWVSGHRHGNTVTALRSPDAAHPELGFWEIETSSLREFPQQFRTFQIVRNSDNTVSIITTDVDPAVKDGSLAATARSYAVAAAQVFKVQVPFPPAGAYNAELVKPLSAEMQAKLARLGN